MEKKKYLVTRNMTVEGRHVAEGETVEVEADRVHYLVAQGWLVDAPEDTKKNKKANKPADKPADPATEPTPEPTPEPEQGGE